VASRLGGVTVNSINKDIDTAFALAGWVMFGMVLLVWLASLKFENDAEQVFINSIAKCEEYGYIHYMETHWDGEVCVVTYE
jgi:hypothetical protein